MESKLYMIKITFTGAVRTVTGSRHLLEVNGRRILLDCGLFQGKRKETYERNLNFPFKPEDIEALILSHAHMDHIGDIPNLVRQGFQGDIHCTLATADLMAIMLMDSARIQENDAAYATKVRKKHNEPPVEPLYTPIDIPPVLQLLAAHGYSRRFEICAGVAARFQDAGHVLGSALTIMNIDDNGRALSLCYTGDLGRANLPIIRDPYVARDADILITESTYGNRLHGDIKQTEDKLSKVINQTVNRGGKIIIPSFALERTQEIIYTLHKLRLEKRIPDFPIYVDSPLAIDATEIFRLHPECFDSETHDFLLNEGDPFGFKQLHYTRSTEESKKLNTIQGPVMIIAGSGMAENGRILHHLKNNITDPRNTILIVGWQAEYTLGRKIQDRLDEVPIFGELYKLKAQVEVFDEFSAHADLDDLIRWIEQGKWKKIFVVHGEESASLNLAEELRRKGFADVIVPELGEAVEI